jgi:hypothetical protein
MKQVFLKILNGEKNEIYISQQRAGEKNGRNHFRDQNYKAGLGRKCIRRGRRNSAANSEQFKNGDSQA